METRPKNLYVSGKVYSQPWYNATFLYFGTVIFRILACLELETYSEKWNIQNSSFRLINDMSVR